MKLRTKILAAELPLLVLLVGVSVYAVKTIVRFGNMTTDIVKANLESVLAAEGMNAAVAEADAALALSLDRETAPVASISASIARFERELAFQERNITEEGEAEATAALRAAFDRWRAAAREAALAPAEARRELYAKDVVPAEQAVRAAAQQILTLNQDAIFRKSAETRRWAEQVSHTLAFASVAALVFAAFLGVFFADRISRPLGRLSESARRIGEGRLDVALEAADGDDEVAHLVQEFRNMTEKLRTYRTSSLGELLEATEAAQAAIDSLADPVVTFDEKGSFRRANEAARTLLGVDGNLEQPLSHVVPELGTAIERVRDRVLRGKGPQAPRGLENAIPILIAEQPRYVQPIGTPIYSEHSGAIVGVTVLVRDVTSLRRADELKNDLLATVAHEFRTPLTSVRMGLHLCLEGKVGPLNEKQTELLHTARDDAERLHRLVDGILSVSKIEAGVLVGRRRGVEPRALVEAAVSQFRVAASDRRLALEARAPEAPLVEVDQDSVVLVLANMIGNALKHTPEGGRIAVSAEARADGVWFSVTDTGTGIAEEHRPRLFEKFYRVPGSPPGGTGLGLSIARDIVFAHDGEIGVESEVGKGSRFWFRLPARKALSQSSDQSSEWPAVPPA